MAAFAGSMIPRDRRASRAAPLPPRVRSRRRGAAGRCWVSAAAIVHPCSNKGDDGCCDQQGGDHVGLGSRSAFTGSLQGENGWPSPANTGRRARSTPGAAPGPSATSASSENATTFPAANSTAAASMPTGRRPEHACAGEHGAADRGVHEPERRESRERDRVARHTEHRVEHLDRGLGDRRPAAACAAQEADREQHRATTRARCRPSRRVRVEPSRPGEAAPLSSSRNPAMPEAGGGGGLSAMFPVAVDGSDRVADGQQYRSDGRWRPRAPVGSSSGASHRVGTRSVGRTPRRRPGRSALPRRPRARQRPSARNGVSRVMSSGAGRARARSAQGRARRRRTSSRTSGRR